MRAWLFIVLFLLSLNFSASALDMVLPEREKIVTLNCREFPDVSYKLFLPESYTPSKPCAIIYTFSPGGGGMVEAHKCANNVVPAIIVGITGTKNGCPEMEYVGEVYAVMWDTLDRFNLSSTAQYAAGFSGGAVMAYNLARQYKERISGVMASGGWLQMMYDPWFVYPRGLLVARTDGTADKGANSYSKKDAEHLKKAACIIKDWTQSGGHAVANQENVEAMMRWLISQQQKDVFLLPPKTDQWNRNSYSQSVFKDLLTTIMQSRHSRMSNLALLKLFEMMKDDKSFCKMKIVTSLRSEEMVGFFGYTAYGAAFAKDTERFNSAAYALDKLCADRNSKWGGIIASIYLFSPEGVGDSKKALEVIKKYNRDARKSPYNQLVFIAALLKNGMAAEARSAAKGLGKNKESDKRVAAVRDNLDKALKDGPDVLDPKIWFQGFGEGD